MSIAVQIVCCFLATVTFSVLFRTPRKSVLLCGGIAALGYALYLVLGNNLWSYYAATLLIALLGEVCARWRKMPAVIFISTAVVPLVPGTGLYYTMLRLVENDYAGAGQTGAFTLLAMGAMALAIATNALLVRWFFPRKKAKNEC
ncbi:MAG: threonine/serine exporter family protein [Eubacteriales bacterium]|nr:threonine/serine exporter family protein [Eubacteriales bacterium]